MRSTFPGTVYQLGNLVASSNLTLQALIVEGTGQYSTALAVIAVAAGLVIALLLAFGPEAHGVAMTSHRGSG